MNLNEGPYQVRTIAEQASELGEPLGKRTRELYDDALQEVAKELESSLAAAKLELTSLGNGTD